MKIVILKFSSCLRSLKAFTLVETLMTVLFFTVISGAAVTMMMSTQDSWKINSVKVELQQEMRKAMDWMNLDFSQAGASTITNVPADGTWYTTITFQTVSGVSGANPTWNSDTIRFLLAGTNSNQLQRISGATTKIIAQNILTLQFRRLAATPNLLEISLQGRKATIRGATLTLSSSAKIKLGN